MIKEFAQSGIRYSVDNRTVEANEKSTNGWQPVIKGKYHLFTKSAEECDGSITVIVVGDVITKNEADLEGRQLGSIDTAEVGQVVITHSRGAWRFAEVVKVGRKNITVKYTTRSAIEWSNDRNLSGFQLVTNKVAGKWYTVPGAVVPQSAAQS